MCVIPMRKFNDFAVDQNTHSEIEKSITKTKSEIFFFENLSQKIKMTNSKEIDEIVGEMDQYESLSNSEASFDLAPTIQKEIKQLADSLR